MTFRARLMLGASSIAALTCAAAPALADTTTSTSSSTTVSEVVVTGIRESLERAIEIKRNNVDQVDAISATDIGKLPDKNVADALQRIAGVNTESAASGEGGFDENDRVSIRGTSPSLTQVMVDGHNIATGDWFILDQFSTVGRSVSFTLLPAEMVSSTVVYKTQDASLLEGGVAGDVDILTPSAIDLGKNGHPLFFEGSVEAAYNSNSGETKPQVNGTVAWSNPDETFGVSLQGFYEDRSIERFGQETLGYTTITAADPLGAAHPSLIGVQAPSLIGSTLFQQEKVREGGHFDVEWRPSDRVELNLDGFYSNLKASNVNDNYMYWGSNEVGNNLPTSYTVANNTLTSAMWPLKNPGGTIVDGIVVDNIVRPGASAYTSYINLDGKFKVTDNFTLKFKVGYTQGEGETNGSPSFEVDAQTGVNFQQSGNGWQVAPTNIIPSSPAGLANDWAWNEAFFSKDKEIYGQFDGEYDLDAGVFKDITFGFHAAQHTRQVDGWDRGCSLGANGECWTSPAMPFSATNPVPYPSGFNAGNLGIPGLLIPIAGQPSTIVNILNSINDGVHGPLSSIIQPQNYYWMGAFKVQENDYSGYLMTHLSGDGWRGNVGLRLADTQENAYVNTPGGANPITTSAFGPYTVDHVQHNYLDPLPSANFTFDLQKDVLLRLSAAETMARPDYSALGATFSLTDLTHVGNGGNANLKPIKSANFDAALEWYYEPTAVAAVSVFYDDLQSYVTYGTNTQTFLNMLDNKFEPFVISSPYNIAGHLEGVEGQVQQPLPYNFGVQGNLTYIQGHDAQGNPLVGLSDITYNLVGYYEIQQMSVRLAYTYRSSYLVGLDRSSLENQAGYGELDASFNLNITKNVTFTVDALNLTNTLLKYYAQNPTQVRAVYDNGAQVYGGFHVKF